MDGGSRAERPRRVPASQPSGGRTPPHTSAHRKKLGLQQHLHHLSRCTASSAPPSTPRGRGPSFIIAVSRLPVRLTCLASPRLALHHPCFVRRGIHHHHHYLPRPRRRPNSPRVYFPDAQQQHQAARFLMTTSDYPPRPSSLRLHLVFAPANTYGHVADHPTRDPRAITNISSISDDDRPTPPAAPGARQPRCPCRRNLQSTGPLRSRPRRAQTRRHTTVNETTISSRSWLLDMD